MELDFSGMSKVVDFVTVPEGTYLCRVDEVLPGVTRNGDERWGMRLVVAEGEYVGRQAAWDSLAFTERGKIRARLVFGALGLPTEGKVEVHPEDLIGKEALVTIRPSRYRSPGSEQEVRRNEVPYDGYRAVRTDLPLGTGPDPAPDPAVAPAVDPGPDLATDSIPF